MTRPTNNVLSGGQQRAQRDGWVREVDDKTLSSDHSAVALDRVYARVHNHPTRYVSARPLSRFIPDLTKTVFQKRGFSSAQLISEWSAIIGAHWAEQCQPEKLTWPRSATMADEIATSPPPGATLVLRTDPAFALEIEYASAQIADRINAHFGYRAIVSIKIIQGPLPPAGGSAPALQRNQSAGHTRPNPPSAPRAAFQDLLEDVEDHALQAALRRLGKSLAHAGS